MNDHAVPAHRHGEPGHVHDQACAAAHGELALPPDRRRLVLVFSSPVAQEMAALADRLGWPVTVVDPDRARLDADPVPYARTFPTISEAGLDDGCDVVVCDLTRDPRSEDFAARTVSNETERAPSTSTVRALK